MKDFINALIDRKLVHIEPHDAVIAFKPRKLTLGIATRAYLDEFASLIHRNHAVKGIDDLFIANRLHRSQGISQPLVHKTTNLINKTQLKHQIDA